MSSSASASAPRESDTRSRLDLDDRTGACRLDEGSYARAFDSPLAVLIEMTMDRVDASESFTRRSLPRALSHYVRPNWSLLVFKRRAAEALIQYVYSTRTCTGKIKVFMSLI